MISSDEIKEIQRLKKEVEEKTKWGMVLSDFIERLYQDLEERNKWAESMNDKFNSSKNFLKDLENEIKNNNKHLTLHIETIKKLSEESARKDAALKELSEESARKDTKIDDFITEIKNIKNSKTFKIGHFIVSIVLFFIPKKIFRIK